MDIKNIVDKQRKYYKTGKTIDLKFRHRMLNMLDKAIRDREKQILFALYKDLGKSETEAYMCEVGLVLSELRYVKKHLNSWAAKKHVPTPIVNFAGSSYTIKEPYGVTLVMSPWNYPILLTIDPLIAAIAAGNTCVVKPSAYAPHTAAIIAEMLESVFPEEYIAVVRGGRAENTLLLDQKFDMIFFTGSVAVGKQVMKKASDNLTPVILELGGKSPVIIDKTANLKVAAARIAFGKYLNLGQTCVAPDYVLIDKSVKREFMKYLIINIKKMYGEDPLSNPDYGKMINRKHFDRVMKLIDENKLLMGGQCDVSRLKIAPTVLDNVSPDDAVMQEEIFGPVLPIIEVNNMDEAFSFVQDRPEPLALYLFTSDKKAEERFVKGLKYGGGCINDTVIHLVSSDMGFGGVGNSGMGTYHGKKSFEAFSHEKSIINKYTFIDLPLRNQPYKEIYYKLIRICLNYL